MPSKEKTCKKHWVFSMSSWEWRKNMSTIAGRRVRPVSRFPCCCTVLRLDAPLSGFRTLAKVSKSSKAEFRGRKNKLVETQENIKNNRSEQMFMGNLWVKIEVSMIFTSTKSKKRVILSVLSQSAGHAIAGIPQLWTCRFWRRDVFANGREMLEPDESDKCWIPGGKLMHQLPRYGDHGTNGINGWLKWRSTRSKRRSKKRLRWSPWSAFPLRSHHQCLNTVGPCPKPSNGEGWCRPSRLLGHSLFSLRVERGTSPWLVLVVNSTCFK